MKERIFKNKKGSKLVETMFLFPFVIFFSVFIIGSAASSWEQRKAYNEISSIFRGDSNRIDEYESSSDSEAWDGRGMITAITEQAKKRVNDAIRYLSDLDGGKRYFVYSFSIDGNKYVKTNSAFYSYSDDYWISTPDKSKYGLLSVDDSIKDYWKIGSVIELRVILYFYQIRNQPFFDNLNSFTLWDHKVEIFNTSPSYTYSMQVENQ